jgi:hypothetical protein
MWRTTSEEPLAYTTKVEGFKEYTQLLYIPARALRPNGTANTGVA